MSDEQVEQPASDLTTHRLFPEKELVEEAIKKAVAGGYDALQAGKETLVEHLQTEKKTLAERLQTGKEALAEHLPSTTGMSDTPKETAKTVDKNVRDFGSEVFGGIKTKVDAALVDKENSPASDTMTNDFVKLEKPHEAVAAPEESSIGQSISATFSDFKEKMAPAAEAVDSQLKAAAQAFDEFFKKEEEATVAASQPPPGFEQPPAPRHTPTAPPGEGPLVDFGDFIERKVVHPLEMDVTEMGDTLMAATRKTMPEKEVTPEAGEPKPSALSVMLEGLVEHPASKNFPVYDERAASGTGHDLAATASAGSEVEEWKAGAKEHIFSEMVRDAKEAFGAGENRAPAPAVLPAGKETAVTCPGCWLRSVCDNEHVHKLIYWKEPYKSALALVCVLTLTLAFVMFSAVSVLSYVGLTLLAVTFSYRTFSSVAATMQKTEQKNPFREYLDKNVSLDRNKAREIVEDLVKYSETAINRLKSWFLIENIVDSLKFGLFLWILTFIGAWFSGTVLVLLVVVYMFTVPFLCDKYKEQIGRWRDVTMKKYDEMLQKADSKLPWLKLKSLRQKKAAAHVD